jgi:PAS domain S-box-containing protein
MSTFDVVGCGAERNMAVDTPGPTPSSSPPGPELEELVELYELLERLPGERAQRRARELLQRIERRAARLDAVVQDQTELVFRFHAGGRVTFVNRACCRYWRKARVELLGRPVQSLLPQDGWKRLLRTARSLNSSEPVTQLEPRVLGPDGLPRYHEWTLRLIRGREAGPGENVVVGGAEYQVVARDVTERQQQQQLLAQHIAARRAAESELRADLASVQEQLDRVEVELERLRGEGSGSAS